MMVRLNIAVERDVWRNLRDLTEERKGNGRTSVAQIIREMVTAALAKREGESSAR